MTPANERKAKERQAKRDAGLVRVEVWATPKRATLIRILVDCWKAEDQRAQLDQPTP